MHNASSDQCGSHSLAFRIGFPGVEDHDLNVGNLKIAKHISGLFEQGFEHINGGSEKIYSVVLYCIRE